jgi:hypothetical protein
MKTEPPLGLLVHRISEARTAVDRCRHGPVARDELAAARRELVKALQAYTSALDRRALPVPSRLRAELRLHRELFER